MPHCVLLYTPNVEAKTDMPRLCRTLADEMLTILDEGGKQVFPTGGTRVLAYPAAHYAVADGQESRVAQADLEALKDLVGFPDYYEREQAYRAAD